jgi:hypothetical protein
VAGGSGAWAPCAQSEAKRPSPRRVGHEWRTAGLQPGVAEPARSPLVGALRRWSSQCSGVWQARRRGSVGGNRDAVIAVRPLRPTVADLVVVARVLDEHVGRRLEPRRRIQRASGDRDPTAGGGLSEQARSADPAEPPRTPGTSVALPSRSRPRLPDTPPCRITQVICFFVAGAGRSFRSTTLRTSRRRSMWWPSS